MEVGLNFKETELCLALPGGGGTFKINGKRGFSETVDLKLNLQCHQSSPLDLKDTVKSSSLLLNDVVPLKDPVKPPPAKAQVVGWPPVRSFRKNVMAAKEKKSGEEEVACSGGGGALVKVSMDGAPYLRKVDLKMYNSYKQVSDGLGNMFSSFSMHMG